MAYRSLTLALEGPLRASPARVFAEAALHVVDGRVPSERHRAAGRAAEATGLGDAGFERRGAESLALDLNPFVLGMAWSSSRRGALSIHQSQNIRWSLEARTFAEPSGALGFRPIRRVLDGADDDPAPCLDAHMAGMDVVLAGLPISAGSARPQAPAAGTRSSLTELAELLGVSSSAAAEAARVFETEPWTRAADLASRLGCGNRAMQQQLKAEGVTAVGLRQAAMLVRATALLRTEGSATEAAHAAGYADLAHMTRAFVASCGVPPSVIQAAMRGG